jgi:hypothetical protein
VTLWLVLLFLLWGLSELALSRLAGWLAGVRRPSRDRPIPPALAERAIILKMGMSAALGIGSYLYTQHYPLWTVGVFMGAAGRGWDEILAGLLLAFTISGLIQVMFVPVLIVAVRFAAWLKRPR